MIDTMFNTEATVKRLTTATTKMGSVAKTFITRIAALPCRLSLDGRGAMSEVDEYGKKTVVETWRLYCSATEENKAIIESDVITVGGRDYEVMNIYNPALLDEHLEITLRQVR